MDERAAAEAAAAAAPEPPAPDPRDAVRAQIDEAALAAQRVQEAARAEAARAGSRADAAEAEAARQREERNAAERLRIEADAQKESERRHGRLAELAAEGDAAAGDADLASARRRLTVARREWKDVTAGISAIDPALAERFAAADARLTARDTEAHETDARLRREALARLQQLAARVEPLAAKADLSLKAGERALHDVRAALADVPPLPSKREHDDIVRRLKAAQSALTPKVQELREAEDWKRFANAGVQEQLCARMEALRALEDPEALANEIRDLQQQWRQVADVPRAQGEALWRRFKAAHDEVWPRCEAHFAAQAEARAASLAAKVALCERAEALAESTNWIQTADEIKRLQAEWKTIGPVTRGQEKAIWERFRAACDRFFTRRHEDLAQRKTMWAENLREERSAGGASRSARAVDRLGKPPPPGIKRLQAEWKTIGPVKKTRSEAIWQRFRGACDLFFSRYAQRHDIAKAERVAAREAICAELEALAVASPQSPVDSPPAASPRASHRSIWASPFAAFARSGSRRLPPAASIAIARWRSTSALPRRSTASSRGGRRSSAAPSSIPTRTARAWKRSSRGSRISRRRSAARPAPRPTRRSRRPRVWRRCSRKRSPPTRLAARWTRRAGGAPRRKTCVRRRRAGRGLARSPKTRAARSPIGLPARAGASPKGLDGGWKAGLEARTTALPSSPVPLLIAISSTSNTSIPYGALFPL